MPYGIINIPVTDLRAEPDSTSERRSQLLFGMAVEVGKTRGNFSRIKLLDQYSGWCRTGHIGLLPQDKWEKYVARPKQKVKAEAVAIKGGPNMPTHPFRLFFNTDLVVKPHNGQIHFELPVGRIRAPISNQCLLPVDKKRKIEMTGKKIVSTASRFLGTPYLWGGLTPFGYDCSGLVQMVFGFYGIKLPRDSKDQRNAGEPVERDKLEAGDLIFSPGHVAISCGGSEILHASAGRGMVAFDSLNPKAPNYREDLDRDYEFARRILT